MVVRNATLVLDRAREPQNGNDVRHDLDENFGQIYNLEAFDPV